MILYRGSTTYYPQAYGQVENTNKILKIILTKIVNANRSDRDTKLHTAFWTYRTACKITTKYILFSLVLRIKALLPIAYMKENKKKTICNELHLALKKKKEQLQNFRFNMERNRG